MQIRRICLWRPGAVLALLLIWETALSAAQRSPWQTLAGEEPLVIAKGGMSVLFPDSSDLAYSLTHSFSRPDTVLWCNVQLTKDGVGLCLPDIKMDNSTDITDIFPDGKNDYIVNDVPVSGWFALDYEYADLVNVSLIQGIYSRSNKFDEQFPILAVDDFYTRFKPPIWLNFQYNMFYSQHNLSMRSYFISLTRRLIIDYVSSPEVSFLNSIQTRVMKSRTHLIFRFMDPDALEPSMNQSYGSLAKNMTFIKSFASGILLPKSYIWPVDTNLYLLPQTSIVSEAHKAGLKVFAADFANDFVIAYNYSYDPIAECVSFVSNGVFSVDGILTDSPVTASSAIGCFSHMSSNSTPASLTVITHNGASGVYPGCTDLAYTKAINDGADYIDCNVQVTKDGVLVCMDSVDLFTSTNIVKSIFGASGSIVPEIQSHPGVFTFNLTWEDIQKNLRPEISSSQRKYSLYRNPLYQNAGNFMTLSDFLALAKNSSLVGVVIIIENAAFSNEKLGFSLTDSVQEALDKSGFNNQTALEIMIMSTDSSVLKIFKQQTKYKLTYMIDESISGALNSSIQDISDFAQSVAISKESVYPANVGFVIGRTDIVKKFQAANLSVYAYTFMNEFTSQPWDFFSDPTVEINTYFQEAGVNGIITDFPGTAVSFRKNPCLNLGNDIPKYMLPVLPGDLLTLLAPEVLPPAVAPSPVLTDADVIEPPLPPTSPKSTISSPGIAGTPDQSQPSSSLSGPCLSSSFFSLTSLAALMAIMASLSLT